MKPVQAININFFKIQFHIIPLLLSLLPRSHLFRIFLVSTSLYLSPAELHDQFNAGKYLIRILQTVTFSIVQSDVISALENVPVYMHITTGINFINILRDMGLYKHFTNN
jgi:hypothetical protein